PPRTSLRRGPDEEVNRPSRCGHHLQIVPAVRADRNRARIGVSRGEGAIIRLHYSGAVIVIAEPEHAPFAGMLVTTELPGQRSVEHVDVQFEPPVDLKYTLRRAGGNRHAIQFRRGEA